MGIFGGALFGGVFFLWISGWRVVDPTQFEWLMKLDWRINFLGWHLFRNDPWLVPPGRIAGYLAGEGTTIGFTDSVPVMALLVKPFDAWLPTPFQYFGIWLLLCFVLQGTFGALITRLYSRNPLAQVSGGALFVLVPTLLIRVGHPALTAHFVLLATLWLYLRSDRATPSSASAQIGVATLAGLTHPYLGGMALALLTAVLLRDRTWRAIGTWAAAAGAMAVAWWVAGFVAVSNTTDLSAGGLGLYSMNLLSPVTPRGWSTILPEWPLANEFQAYEGFQYLGAGVLLLLLAAAAVTALVRRAPPLPRVSPLVLVCLACALYALSPRITVGQSVVVDWSNPWIDRLAFFRASGRFFWPMTYFLLSVAIANVVVRLRTSIALTLLCVCLAVQFIDLRAAHQERRLISRSDAFHAWPRQLVSRAWHEVLPHYRHLALVPASQCGGAPLEHEELAYLAGLHGLSINSGLGARWDESARRAYCGALDVAISRGQLRDDTLYVVTPAYEERLQAAGGRAVCGTIDIARVCVTTPSLDQWQDVSPAIFGSTQERGSGSR